MMWVNSYFGISRVCFGNFIHPAERFIAYFPLLTCQTVSFTLYFFALAVSFVMLEICFVSHCSFAYCRTFWWRRLVFSFIETWSTRVAGIIFRILSSPVIFLLSCTAMTLWTPIVRRNIFTYYALASQLAAGGLGNCLWRYTTFSSWRAL